MGSPLRGSDRWAIIQYGCARSGRGVRRGVFDALELRQPQVQRVARQGNHSDATPTGWQPPTVGTNAASVLSARQPAAARAADGRHRAAGWLVRG